MPHSILILGGTMEATALAQAVHTRGIEGLVSFAGRVERPKRQPLPIRVGGFGGVDGLAAFLRNHAITHVIDATHPFAAQMSRNAVAACTQCDVPLIALNRPAWEPQDGDQWQRVRDIQAAVAALVGAPQRIMLAVGRMHLAEFAPNPQHHYLLRLVDPPQTPPPLPNAHVVVSRGPFTEADDRALMESHGIDLVVSKNSGGTGAYAKIAAARSLGLPVLMIDRPDVGRRPEVESVDEVLDWIARHVTDLGV